jgi:NADPH-dependent glutamate synthase beta subunit-like oxidoreductase
MTGNSNPQQQENTEDLRPAPDQGASRGDGFDAAFVAVGAHIGKRAYIPAGDSAKIMDAVSLLHSVEDGTPPLLGRRVDVYGGGNTWMDAGVISMVPEET